MPREGLSETGQIIAAVATAIILALLAKYGFLPDEDDGKKESEGTQPTVINIQIGTQRIEEAAREGRDAMTPAKGTPPREGDEPFEDLDVGALPIQSRVKPIMSDIGRHVVTRRPPTTMHLVVVLDKVYGTQKTISVWSYGYDGIDGDIGWSKLGVKKIGDLNGQMHFLVEVPINWSAKDASGRVRQLMVLCRTGDATKEPDAHTCAKYLVRARVDASEKYVLKADKVLRLFDVTSGNQNGVASLATITRDTLREHVPAIYIPNLPQAILPER